MIDALEVAFTNPLDRQLLHRVRRQRLHPPGGAAEKHGQVCAGHQPQRGRQHHFHQRLQRISVFWKTWALASARKRAQKKASADEKEPLDEAELNKLLCSILEEQTDKDELYASELKGILLRLRA